MENEEKKEKTDLGHKKIGIGKGILIIIGTFVLLFVIIGIIASSSEGEKKEIKPEQQLPQETPQTSQEEQKELVEEPPITEGQPKQEQEQEKQAWQEVKSWSGSGIKNTEPFEITGNQWRVKWQNKGGEFGGGILQIFVYKVGSESPEELLANTTEITSDTSYIYEGGTFYLNVNSANTNWSITVEELK